MNLLNQCCNRERLRKKLVNTVMPNHQFDVNSLKFTPNDGDS